MLGIDLAAGSVADAKQGGAKGGLAHAGSSRGLVRQNSARELPRGVEGSVGVGGEGGGGVARARC